MTFEILVVRCALNADDIASVRRWRNKSRDASDDIVLTNATPEAEGPKHRDRKSVV